MIQWSTSPTDDKVSQHYSESKEILKSQTLLKTDAVFWQKDGL
jgi:hypothetical protein